jgi:bacterial/archaeal transporter family protein
MWMVLAAGSAVFAALVTLLGKIGLREIDPTLATIVRGVLMAVLLVIIGLVFRKFEAFDTAAFTTKAWLYIFLAALAGALSWICYFAALRLGPAGAVAVIDKLSVVIIVIAAAFLFGETFTAWTGVGVVLLIIGSALIIFG